jgi:hypothetical protein
MREESESESEKRVKFWAPKDLEKLTIHALDFKQIT